MGRKTHTYTDSRGHKHHIHFTNQGFEDSYTFLDEGWPPYSFESWDGITSYIEENTPEKPMTNHLTPGAQALLDEDNGKEVVEILDPSGKSKYGKKWIQIRECYNHFEVTSFVHVSRLTPLLTAVVQEDGTVREVNPLGEEPQPTVLPITYMSRDAMNRYEAEMRDWQAAESQRRTWPVEPNGPCGYWMALIGRSVLGYVPSGKFIIVETQNQ